MDRIIDTLRSYTLNFRSNNITHHGHNYHVAALLNNGRMIRPHINKDDIYHAETEVIKNAHLKGT